MIIKATNETESNISLPELNGYVLYPDTQVDLAQVFAGQIYRLASSDVLTVSIANGDITINNGSEDLTPSAALQYVILQNIIEGPKDSYGRLKVQPSNRAYGKNAGWSGEGDDPDHYLNVYGGQRLFLIHEVGDDNEQYVDFYFNVVANDTQLHETITMWEGAKGDQGQFSVFSIPTTWESGSNTYYQSLTTGNPLIDSMIFPAAGDGNINVTADLTDPNAGLTQIVADADGIMLPGYWYAEFNESTGLYENIAAAPAGDGNCNLFHAVTNLFDLGNRMVFTGTGVNRVGSPDTRSFGHGVRCRMTIYTNTDVDDHEWSLAVNLGLHRDSITRVNYA